MLAERTIRKHVTIIHAYSMMSVLQRKVVNVLLYEAINNSDRLNHRNSVAIESRISFSDLSKAVKFTSNNTHYLKEAIDGLASLKIEWNLLKDKAPTELSFLNLRVLHGAPTFYKDNTLNFSFHKLMLALVDNPNIYGTVNIDLQSEFESKYSHALYENSTRFVNLQQNKIISLDTFKQILGVPENKYMCMRELTRNVIRPSKEEVNDRANFVINLSTIKNGKQIVGIEIGAKNKNKTSANVSHNAIEPDIKSTMQNTFGDINKSLLANILLNYSEEYILEKIAYTKKFSKIKNSGFYPLPYFISAIKFDYKLKEESSPSPISKTSNKTNDWENELHLLQRDLHHWEGLLTHAEKTKNKAQISSIKIVIEKCHEKLEKHILKPNCAAKVE